MWVVQLGVLLLVGSCECGLLGISHSKASSSSSDDDAGGQPRSSYKAQAGQQSLNSGFARQASLAAGSPTLPSKPMLGKSGARPWAMPGSGAESAGNLMMSSGFRSTNALQTTRGPVTGLSKRQMAWRKRRPTEQGKDRAASEINMAVGELEGMQMEIEETKYMNDAMGIRKTKKPNSLPVRDEGKLNQTLSDFGKKQRATDLQQVYVCDVWCVVYI